MIYHGFVAKGAIEKEERKKAECGVIQSPGVHWSLMTRNVSTQEED